MNFVLLQIIVESIRTALIWVGFSLGVLRRPDPNASTAWIAGSGVLLTLWLIVAVFGAANLLLTQNVIPISVALTLVFGLLLLVFPSYRAIIAAIPAHWLIVIQVTRVIGGLFLVRYYQGEIPGIFALPAGIGDVLTGIFAPFVAYAVARKKPYARTAAIVWNIFGMADLVNALALGGLYLDGSLVFPTILIPLYSVPRALVIHIYSLIGLLRRDVQQASSANGGLTVLAQA